MTEAAALIQRLAKLEKQLSSFKEITGVDPSSGPFIVTTLSINRDLTTGGYFISFLSQPGEIFQIQSSVDAVVWEVADNSVNAAASPAISSTWLSVPYAPEAIIYFRVRRYPRTLPLPDLNTPVNMSPPLADTPTLQQLLAMVASVQDQINALEYDADVSTRLRDIHTPTQLATALAETGELILRLKAPITLPPGNTFIPREKTIEFGLHWFIDGGGSTVAFYGECVAERRAIFVGFVAGDIVGTFGGADVYPEWWGLVDSRHDIAINCAVKSAPRTVPAGLDYNNYWSGITVSLAPRVYYVARPIDCTGGYINLKGAGSAQTTLWTTSAWVADTWEQAEIWGNPAVNEPNHAAVIWIGGVYVGAGAFNGATYRNQVTGITINCGDAGFALRTTNKRISGISSKSGVEECSIIDEIVITYATGFGIGFCRHRNTDGNYYPSTVNGLSITNFWIYGATYRDYYGMYFSAWTNNCRVDTGTVAGGLAKSISSQWNVNTSPPPTGVGSDTTAIGTTVYTTDPIWIRTYPQTAIYTSGANVSLNNIHIENSVVGILVAQADAASNVTINNIKVFGLMDRALSPVYALDGVSGLVAAPADNGTAAHYYGYGCGVLIAWYTESTAVSRVNFTGRCTVNNLYASATTYLLRDSIYNVHLSAFGMGEYATTPSGAGVGGLMSFYTRGNIYRVQNISVNGASGNGTTATLTFPTQTIAIPAVGSRITVAGISPSGYNGSYIVTASSSTSVSYLNATTASYVTGGTIGVKLEYNPASPPVDRSYFLGPVF